MAVSGHVGCRSTLWLMAPDGHQLGCVVPRRAVRTSAQPSLSGAGTSDQLARQTRATRRRSGRDPPERNLTCRAGGSRTPNRRFWRRIETHPEPPKTFKSGEVVDFEGIHTPTNSSNDGQNDGQAATTTSAPDNQQNPDHGYDAELDRRDGRSCAHGQTHRSALWTHTT